MKPIGLPVLLALLSLVEGRVILFKQCTQFFPTNGGVHYFPTSFSGRQYKEICQQYKNQYRYATLYDTSNRIPVYSAYLYKGHQNTDRHEWMIEPQLDVEKGPDYMTTEDEAGGPVGDNQAVDADYNGSGYSRGHVYPNDHTNDQNQADSTFTLTNAAPQLQKYNQAWIQAEDAIQRAIRDNCNTNNNPQAYIVTGVTPGSKKMKNRVNIPSYYWSAYCCKDRNNQNRFVSGGYLMQMKEGAQLRTPQLPRLIKLLGKMYFKPGLLFKMFGDLPGCST